MILWIPTFAVMTLENYIFQVGFGITGDFLGNVWQSKPWLKRQSPGSVKRFVLAACMRLADLAGKFGNRPKIG